MKREVLSHREVSRIGLRAGIPFPKEVVVHNRPDALKFAERIGYPVVLKILSPDFVHKTDSKVVVVDVRNGNELTSAYDLIIENAHKFKKNFKFDGVLIQKFIPSDMHVIVGGKKDPSFGPVVLVGSGGIFAEVLKDTVVRVAPVSYVQALEMLDELNIKPILDGFRGLSFDKKAVAHAIVRLSKLMMDHDSIHEVDINPLVVTSNGAFAVDMRIVV